MKGSLEYEPKSLWGPEGLSRGGDPASGGYSGCETDKLRDLSDGEGRLEEGSFVELRTALCSLFLGPQGWCHQPSCEGSRPFAHSSLTCTSPAPTSILRPDECVLALGEQLLCGRYARIKVNFAATGAKTGSRI